MTYLLFFKILKEKLLDFKVKGGMKSVLKWCLKKKKIQKTHPRNCMRSNKF